MRLRELPFVLEVHLHEIAKDSRFGVPEGGKETIVLDYGGPNVAKAMHVGHLRASIIGDTLRRICLFAGYNAVGDVPPDTLDASCPLSGAATSAVDALIRLINWFSWALALLAVAVGLYAGFLYMTAKGDPGKLQTANRVLLYGIVGVAVAILAFSIIAIVNALV